MQEKVINSVRAPWDINTVRMIDYRFDSILYVNDTSDIYTTYLEIVSSLHLSLIPRYCSRLFCFHHFSLSLELVGC